MSATLRLLVPYLRKDKKFNTDQKGKGDGKELIEIEYCGIFFPFYHAREDNISSP